MCIPFNEDEYDFNKYIVYKCIGHVNISEGPRYICMNCHTSLLVTNDDNLHVPYHVKKGIVSAGANFLSALKEFPEYVCTCCHWSMFQKTVRPFHISEYNVCNDVDEKCLITLL